jgi:hypothetical protein|tara:strand:- start:358 stop:537 length:180 start_codon:yes stop_codon:yes gene_type:complete
MYSGTSGRARTEANAEAQRVAASQEQQQKYLYKRKAVNGHYKRMLTKKPAGHPAGFFVL